MQTLKQTIPVLLLILALILVGCSDSIMSVQTETKTDLTSSREIPRNVYTQTIELKPLQEYTFQYSNTGFYSFNAISIADCDNKNKMIEVIGQIDDILVVLNCAEKGFWVRTVTIRNTSYDKVLVEEITLYGSKTGSDPVKTKSKTGN